MKSILIVLLASLSIGACIYPDSDSIQLGKASEVPCVTSHLDLHQEMAGALYRKRANAFFMVCNGDTSDFKIQVAEMNQNGVIHLIINLPYQKHTFTYAQWMQQLSELLYTAEQQYNFDSLRSISLGRFMLTGDLAIAVSQSYQQHFPNITTITTNDYSNLASFLKHSQLGEDFNILLAPYNLHVHEVQIEKAFFTNPDNMLQYVKVDVDTSNIPDGILDCITWIRVERK